ncbi:VWA domain-containing protein, partial [Desulfobulbus sp. US5]|nr:VWA domain-containing protein [Desulfobulbus sp. US5]
MARTLIRSVRAGGGTNIYNGLRAGYEQVQQYSSSRNINRVMLLSDGISRGEVLCTDVALREANNGISLSTFGVGINFNEDLMASLAENGRGMYYFIDHPDEISTILAKEFQLTEQVVATGIRIELELHSGIIMNKVYANNYDIQGSRLIINCGDLSAGERRRYQIRLQPPVFKAGSYKIGDVRLSYTPAGTDQTITAQQELSMRYQPNIAGIDTYEDKGVIERSSVFLVQYARDDAAKATEQGNIQQAQQILSQAQVHLQGRTAQSAKLRKEQQ